MEESSWSVLSEDSDARDTSRGETENSSRKSLGLAEVLAHKETCFEQKGFHQKMAKKLEGYRLKGTFCDVTLVASGRQLCAHRNILAAAVPYFETMFTKSTFKDHAQIQMHGFDAEILDQLLSCAYTGKLEVSDKNVEFLIVGADLLGMEWAKESCCSFLETVLTSSNALKIRELAIKVRAEGLIDVSEKFVKRNFPDVSQTEKFLSLSLAELVQFLKDDQLKTENEVEVFQAGLAWIKQDLELRVEHTAEILSCVRLPLLSMKQIMEIGSDQLVRNDFKCTQLVLEACEYHVTPENRAELTTFSVKPRCISVIYAGSCKGVEVFNPTEEKWETRQGMIHPRSYGAAAVMNEQLYVLGGYYEGSRCSIVEVYSPQKNEWKQLCSFNNARDDAAAAVVENRLYLCGGIHANGDHLSTVECYDTITDSWSMVSCMSQPRRRCAAAVLGKKIYVFGGHDGTSPLNSVECYDPQTGVWTTVASMIHCRSGAGAATLNNRLYVCGGSSDKNNFLKSVECYDPVIDQWKEVASMKTGRFGVALIAANGILYAVGGYGPMIWLKSVEVYNPEDNAWNTAPDMLGLTGRVVAGAMLDY